MSNSKVRSRRRRRLRKSAQTIWRTGEAPCGLIWVCSKCGKLSRQKAPRGFSSSVGWDSSCMVNAVLCYEASLRFKGRLVTYADPYEPMELLRTPSDYRGRNRR